jgi:hypothetical protein
MAVQSETSSITYAGNNSTSLAYPVPFTFFRQQDLVAKQKNPQGNVATVAFTASGAGNQAGGSIVTTVAVPPENTLTIARSVEATQLTSYAEGGDFPAASHERALDKLTMLVQQIKRNEDRTVRFGEAAPVINAIDSLIPNRVIGTDTAGALTMLPPVQAGFNFKGQVATLPASGDEGDVYTLSPSNDIYVYDSGWVFIGTLSVGNDLSTVLTNAGDLISRDSFQPVRIPLGTNGRFLRAGVAQPFYDDCRLADIKAAGATDKQVAAFSTGAGQFTPVHLDPSYIRGTASNGQILTFNSSTGSYQATDQLTKANSLVPAGTIIKATSEPSADWLVLNGLPVSRSLNPDLFAIYGESFGAGNGSTTFGLPHPEPWRWHRQTESTLPATRTYGTLNYLPDGRLLWIGGISTASTRVSNVYLGTIRGDSITWVESTAIPSARSEHSVCIAPSGKIYVIGGANSAGTPINTVSVGTLLGNTISWVEGSSYNMIGVRARHTATLLPDGRLMVLGGINTGGDSGVAVATTEFGTIGATSISWVAGTATPVPLRTHTANLLQDGSVLVVGGQSTATTSLATVYQLTVSGNAITYTTKQALPVALSRHATAITPSGHIMVFGGFAAANVATAYFGAFDTNSTLRWDTLTNIPVASRELSSDILPDGRIIIAGGLETNPIARVLIRLAGPFDYIRR